MYKVPMEIPKHCNKCPFGRHQYTNIKNTYGYVCNIDFNENGKYTQVLRAQIGKDIKRPDWCKLIDMDAKRLKR